VRLRRAATRHNELPAKLDEADHSGCSVRDDRRARVAVGSRPPPPVALHVGEHELPGVPEIEDVPQREPGFGQRVTVPLGHGNGLDRRRRGRRHSSSLLDQHRAACARRRSFLVHAGVVQHLARRTQQSAH